MKLFPSLVLSLIVAHSFGAMPISEREPETPKFTGTALPVPPHQKDPWTLDAEAIPEKWIDAVRALFAQGLADPRGGEYREVELVVGRIWGGSQILTAHAWVLPRPAGATQDFAVCWNGLVYPVVKVGPALDFRTDPVPFDKNPLSQRVFPRGEAGMVKGNMSSNSGLNTLPIKACLLLRLGEPALAREAIKDQMRADREYRLWREEELVRNAGVEPPPREEPLIDMTGDPYLEWARQWAWALWDRAVCAHMRGDDQLALISFRQLVPMQHAIDREAAKRHLPAPSRDNSRTPSTYLPWLEEPLSRLLADQEQRATLPQRPKFTGAGPNKSAPPATGLTSLIEDLQDVAVRQRGQPGGVEPFIQDPIVTALVGSGEDAIEPLLRAWETNGRRLTRSISFGRDFHADRFVHPISEPIVEALAAIMQVEPKEFQTLPGGATPAAIRDYWRTAQGVAPAERWYRVFADNDAGPKAWLHAAELIVRPAKAPNPGDDANAVVKLPPGHMIRFAGESLRSKMQPSLSELWRKRVSQITPVEIRPDSGYAGLRDTCELALQFSEWDEPAAIPSIRETLALCFKLAEEQPSRLTSFRWYLPKFTLLLARSGDGQALDDYCSWLLGGRTEPQEPSFYRSHWSPELRQSVWLFEPLWSYPKAPAVKTAVARIFAGPNPPIAPLLGDRLKKDGPLTGIVKTPLLGFPEVRSFALAALEDHTEMGEAEAIGGGLWRNPGFSNVSPTSKPGTVVNSKVKYRVCDFHAWLLAYWKELPLIELSWPEAQRDSACAEAARVLREEDGNFRQFHPRPVPDPH